MIYELILSKGQTIKIDEEDLQKIRENISSSLIQIKQGIFNPSFMVMIVPTNEESVKIQKRVEIRGGTPVVIKDIEVKVLSDLMSDVRKLES